MKRITQLIVALIVVASLCQHTVHAQVVCGQPIPGNPPAPPPCVGDCCTDDPTSGSLSSPFGSGVNVFTPQTGNVWRQIPDLAVYGGVGDIQLIFKRVTTSRYEGGIPTPLGTAGNWRHSFFWNIYWVGTNSIGNEIINVDYPNGKSNRFDKKTANDLYLTSWSSAMHERVEPPAQGSSDYSLWFPDGQRMVFTKTGSGSSSTFAVKGLYDPYNQYYPFILDGNGRVTRVTEPGGRYINLTYKPVGNFGVGNVSFKYTSSTATNICVAGTFNGWSTTANPLVNSNGTWTTVIPLQLGAYPYKYMINGTDWALDQSNPNTVPDGYGGSNSLVTVQNADNGVDSGSPTPVDFVYTNSNAGTVTVAGAFNGWSTTADPLTQSGSVWHLTKNILNGSYQYKFVVNGTNWVQDPGNPFQTPDGYGGYNSLLAVGPLDEAITQVQSSDGRYITYNYSMYTSGGSMYSMLTQANYEDGTRGQYTYTPPNTYGTRPLLASAADPRYKGAGSRMQYVYNTTTGVVEGFLYQEKNLSTGTVLAQLNVGTTENGQRGLMLGNGGTLSIMFTNTQGVSRTDSLGRTTTYQYYDDGRGMLSSVTDPINRTTSYDLMEHFGTVKTTTYPDGTKRSVTYSSDTKPFFVATQTNELGRVTVYTRDSSNRVTRVDYPDASYEAFAYNTFGQVTTNRLRNGGIEINTYGATGLQLNHRDPEGADTGYTYDAYGRVAAVTNALNHVTQYEYNDRGQITKMTHPDNSYTQTYYDTYGNATNRVDELGHSWRSVHDDYNRVLTQTDPLNRTTTYNYALPGGGGGGCGCAYTANKPSSVTDAKGNVTQYGYDQEWQLTSVTDANGGVTSYTYDAAGNRKTQTDGNVHTYSCSYYARNRVIGETNALSQVTRYAYDAVGNRTNRVDGAGNVTFWNYDVMNQMTGTGSGTLSYLYGFDDGGRCTTMATRVNGTITETTTFSYNARNEVLTKGDPSGYTLSYGYDAVGNRTNLVVGAMLNVSYSYDTRKRVSMIIGNGRSTSFTYDNAGRRTAVTWPNMTTASYEYDNANELLSLVHRTSDGGTLASFSYGYDSGGNRTNMTTLEGVNTYSYASNNWLTGVTYPDYRTQQFSYDTVGNRTNLMEAVGGSNSISTVYSYDVANRLQSSASSLITNVYTYDGAGRLTSQLVNAISRTYAYDFRSQMTFLSDTNAMTYSFEFDGDGNRIRANRGGCLTSRYVYDGEDVVLEINGSNQVVHAYVNGLGIDQKIERIAFVNGTQGARLVYHTDALGSVATMTDNAEQTAKSYSYEAFGNIRSETGTQVIDRYTYTGRESIGDSLGLMYYRWRVMDPNVGRFTSEDPLGFVDGPDMYLYVRNNSLKWKDPQGESLASCILRSACVTVCVTVYSVDIAITVVFCAAQEYACGVRATWCAKDKKAANEECEDQYKQCMSGPNKRMSQCMGLCYKQYRCP